MNKIPKGYKQTEIGIIPEDWEVKTISDVIKGVEYGSSSKSNTIGEIPVLRMGNIQNGKFDFNDLVYTSNSYEINKYLLECNDVLFNRTNTIDLVGKTAIYKGERPAIFAGYLIRINIKPELINSDFLNYWLNTKIAQKYGQQVLSVAVGQANINGTKLKTYPIPLPPTKAEQTAIATAISDADALISSLEKLIEKKRNIKLGAMQKLLQPKEGWVVKTISEISNPVRGGSPRPAGDPKYFNGKFIPWLTVAALTNIPLSKMYVSETESYLTEEGSLLSRILEKDTVIIANSGATLGVAKILSIKCCANDGIAALLDVNKEIDKAYLVHFINTKIKYLREVVATGNGQPNLNTDLIGKIKIPCPSTKNEQTHIATILSDMDAEIEALETKLEKYRNIKLGMMQNLLTGKIRLV